MTVQEAIELMNSWPEDLKNRELIKLILKLHVDTIIIQESKEGE